jgi:aspartyl-tRNA(Asn)/glutamyl-tRNA(Gln) amidotransferase subunit B
MSDKTVDILSSYPYYEAAIGIEVHVQLKTNTKIFCGCPNHFGDQPNSNICPVCTGLPGVLPVLNKKVVDYAIMAGLATQCKINKNSHFARKHYVYPDLPKNYQITQDDYPICSDGHVPIELENGDIKNIRLIRIHMEEDAGKNIHSKTGESFVDLNRTGTPLLEIVSHPDMKSANETKTYLLGLHSIVRFLGVSDANMEEGSFRADVNISVKKKSDKNLGTRVELKNINSFRFVVKAIDYEIERQIKLVESGEKINQETRLWDSKKQETYFMRSKEEAQDYRYFAEPDLSTIEIDDEWLNSIKSQIPELPREKNLRFKKKYGLLSYESSILSSELDIANFFEQTVEICNNAKQVSNWMLRNVFAYLKENKLSINQSKITPKHLGQLISELDSDKINSKVAQEVFWEMISTGKNPIDIISEKGLAQIGLSEELEEIAKKIIQENPKTVEKYKSGSDRVFGFFVGQAMKATRGRANPEVLSSLFKKYLSE